MNEDAIAHWGGGGGLLLRRKQNKTAWIETAISRRNIANINITWQRSSFLVTKTNFVFCFKILPYSGRYN